jgi:3-dehydroquinate synthase
MALLPYLHYENDKIAVQQYLAAKQIIILADEKTNGYCVPVAKNILPALQLAQQINIPAGDSNKTLEVAEFVYAELVRLGANKTTCLVCVGGGMVSDLGAFVASTFMRGMDLVLVPTSLLAMVDAAVGGKTALNFSNTKNLIGSFYEPKICYVDTTFLASLPEQQIKAGTAEMVKHVLIEDDGNFAKFMKCHDANDFTSNEFIKASNETKSKLVSEDLRDAGIRQALNFGHSIAHALEVNNLLGTKNILHGEAVYLGMLAELSLSEQYLRCDTTLRTQLLSLIKRLEIFKQDLQLSEDSFTTALQKDKKNTQTLRMSLLTGIGQPKIQFEVTFQDAINASKLAIQDVC